MQTELPPEESVPEQAQPPPPRPSLWRRTRKLASRVKDFFVRWWDILKPTAEVRRGIYIAVLVFVPLFYAYFGGRQSRFFDPFIDSIGWWLATVLVLILGGLLGALALWLLSGLTSRPRIVKGFLIIATALMSLALMGPIPGPLLLLSVALLGATLASIIAAWKRMAGARRVATVILCVLSVAGIASAAWFLSWEGHLEGLVKYRPAKLPAGEQLSAPDPASEGPFEALFLTYGPGTDLRRPEYGKNVALKSRSVDGSLLLKDIEGWKGKVYKWWWGIDTSTMPLNARVWYPRGDGPFPLVLIVHGNHNGREFSDPGYEYLGRLLASRGYIFASIDENFINGQMPGGFGVKETAARGWLLLEHLRQFQMFNDTAGNPFHRKVDMSNIGLMGHSRGGEAVATAFEFNRLKHFPGDGNQKFGYGFNIKALVAIAPADGQYKPAGVPRKLRDVSYFVIQGSHDYDVSAYAGSSQYQRVSFSESFQGFKASLWIYRANHGMFNTIWNRHDWGEPGVYLLNLAPLLKPEEQRRAGMVYFSAFLDAALRGKEEYRALFEDYRRGEKWLPDTLYRSLYQDARFRPVANFDEDYELASGTLPGATLTGENLATWKEERVPLRWDARTDNGVALGWRKDSKASYAIALPAGFAKLTPESLLEFALADGDETPPPPKDKDRDKKKDEKKDKKKEDDKKEKEPVDFTIELTDAAGKSSRLPLSRLGPICPPMRVKLIKRKLPGFDPFKKEVEPVFQRFSARLGDFAATAPGFDPAKTRSVRFRFDKTQDRVILLDDIGFSLR
jgi:dienelactone hydrolase